VNLASNPNHVAAWAQGFGLRARLVLLVIAAITPLLAFSLYRAASQADLELERARTSLEFAASLAVASQERVAESARLLLTAMVNLPDLHDGNNFRCDAYFDRFRGRFPAYANMGLTGVDGYTRCHALDSKTRTYVGDRAYFRAALATKAFVISQYQEGRLSRVPVITFALPLLDAAGEVRAVAFAALDLRELARSLHGVQLPPGARMAVLDSGGTVLATSNSAFPVGQTVANVQLREAIREGKPLFGEGLDAQGQMRLFALMPGRGAAQGGLFVLVNIDREQVVAPGREWLARELLLVALVALLGSVAAWLVGGAIIAGPARQILAATQQISRGKLDTRLAVQAPRSTNEFARIAEGFNLMAESLQLRQQSLETELAHSRQAYSTLDLVLNSMQEVLVAVDSKGRVLLQNEPSRQLFDLGPTLPSPDTWSVRYGVYLPGTDEHVPTGDLPLQRALRGESGHDMDMEIRNANVPQGRTLRCSYRPIRQGNEIVGALVMMTDLTDVRRLQVEQARSLVALRQAQRRLLEAQAIGRIGNWELDLSTNLLWWSDQVYALFGRDPGSFDGRIQSMLQMMHAQDRDVFMQRRKEAIQQGQSLEMEYRIVLPSGHVRWIHQMGRVYLDDNGNAVRRAGVVQDITARKQAQAELILLRNAVSRLNDVVIITEADPLDAPGPRIVYANDAVVRMTGYQVSELVGQSPRLLQGPRSDKATLARIRQALAQRRPVCEEIINYTRSGVAYWVEIDIAPLFDDSGRLTHFIAVQHDVSERKRAEAEVQEHVYTLQRAADAAQVITQQASLQATLQEVVEQARGVVCAHQAVISISSDVEKGHSVHAFSLSEKYDHWKTKDLPPPDGSGIYAMVCETNKAVRLTQAELLAHPRWRGFGAHAVNHPPMHGWLAVPLIGSDGRNMGVLQLSDRFEGEFSRQDEYVAIELAHLATAAIEKARLIEEVHSLNVDLEARIALRTAELTRQEALFRALAEQAPQVVWTADTEGAVTYINRHWYELVGGQPPEGLGASWVQRLHPDDRDATLANWYENRDAGTPYRGVRRIRGNDGRYHTMSYRAVPVLDAGGQVSFWVGIDADITELKAYEEALKRSNEELEAFSYSVSHDLRAPLQAMDGFTKLLRRELGENQGERARHYMSRIEAGVGRMSELIEDLLSLAQVSRAQMHYREVDLSAMANDLLQELQSHEPGRQVRLQVQDGLRVQADPRLIQLVMQNLLANAWKFSSQKPLADIGFGRDENGAYFVRDNGAGFDMAYSAKLFGAFQRLHTEREFPGTGIGLATVRRIIDRHQGRVWAHSGPDGGATFFFTLQDDSLPPQLADVT
jgi:PAS domain S-box-containing protein